VKGWVFILFFSLFGNLLHSQQIRIGVFRDYTIKRINFSNNGFGYSIFADTIDFGAILQNEFVEIVLAPNNKLELFIGVVSKGKFNKINLVELQSNSNITLTPIIPRIKERKYKNDFEITPGDKCLNIVNVVDFNNYLCGVVESEGGGGKDLEYYKVQALMSRTYALKYKTKHLKEGFDLCDRVHCQAYHSMLRFTKSIEQAVVETEGDVLKDSDGHLADAYFHANCGGQTSEPDYVWNNSISYLNTFKDTFCIYTRQATWEKRIPKHQWGEFLVKKYNYPINDSVYGPLIYNFTQPERMAFYHGPLLGIPLRDIRQEFKLKSTFFTNFLDGDDVLIRGRGYGHGVGLCQEGAMRMAKFQYNYKQIAIYYFPGITIANINQYELFHQKGNLKLCDPYRVEN
jgi:stage II sporulation protein D